MNNNNIYDAHYLQNINNNQPMSNLYAARIFGGLTQQDRMIRDKVKTLDRAVLYSYQAAKVRKIDSNKTVKALINPNKLKPDYDDKIISIRYDYGFSIGDVFEWENTKTHWIIYLQDLTELAYFKGDIRKCQYCYKPLKPGQIDYHPTCAKKLFGTKEALWRSPEEQ